MSNHPSASSLVPTDRGHKAAVHVGIRDLFDRLWPQHRSLGGGGVRETHRLLAEVAVAGPERWKRFEVPTGAKVFDWTVPQEWNFRSASVARIQQEGRRFDCWPVAHSAPIDATLTWADLEPHLHTAGGPNDDFIPYRTNYYGGGWGLCVGYRTWRAMEREGDDGALFHVTISAELIDGSLTLGEVLLPPTNDRHNALLTREILFSAYTCHPQMARNELIGPVVQAFLARAVAAMPNRRFAYRFVWGPETIGALCHLHRLGLGVERIDAGFALSLLGGLSLWAKESRRGGTLADRAASAVFGPQMIPWEPTGSDERQYCSPGFDLPVVSLTGPDYPEYHTSADTGDIVDWPGVERDLNRCVALVELLERNRVYRRIDGGLGEPFLHKRGLRQSMGAANEGGERKAAIEWVLSECDGTKDLLAVTERSGMAFGAIFDAAQECRRCNLLEVVE